jgi:hypothetical protein
MPARESFRSLPVRLFREALVDACGASFSSQKKELTFCRKGCAATAGFQTLP